MYFKRECEMAATAKNCGKKISKNLAHDLTGHINTEESEKTVKYLGYDLNRGGMNPCEACAKGKGKNEKSTYSRTYGGQNSTSKSDSCKTQ